MCATQELFKHGRFSSLRCGPHFNHSPEWLWSDCEIGRTPNYAPSPEFQKGLKVGERAHNFFGSGRN
jgi:hypothetical protein